MDDFEHDIEALLRRFRPQAPPPLPIPRSPVLRRAVLGLAAVAAVAVVYWAWPTTPKPDAEGSGPAGVIAVSSRVGQGKVMEAAAIAPLEGRRGSSGANRTVVADQDVPPPKKVFDVRPTYPEAARANGIQGIVILQVVVGPDGSVGNIQVLKSIAALDEAAMSAVSQWKYLPTVLNGEPVSVVMRVAVNFTRE